MLIPRFTLRNLFAITAGVALAALVTSWGGQGVAWAVGISAALVVLLLIIVVHVSLFAVVWLFSRSADNRDERMRAVRQRAQQSIPVASVVEKA